ncbi:hypothetical protein [Micromonospora sp. NPDC049891]|uniref:hypothetical protein n=1 Tax=Micromonospora sp. NPDC049891 TaxID=3155655 RepID=UPI0033C9278B
MITVNVIYTPGTVHALSRFIPLLVGHTPWRYRLIANHCGPAERRLLRWHAKGSSRLTVHQLPTTNEVMPLGKALCTLAATYTSDEVFAFADSDIVVTGDIAREFEPLLNRHEAVFSGAPIWATDSDQILTDDQTEVAGPHHRTAAGIALGSSYFGLYHRTALDRVMRECRVTLDKYTDLTSCDPRFQAFLDNLGLARASYVPPKVLNLGYTYLGLPIVYHESPHLHHIGGYSMATYARSVTATSAGDTPTSAAEILDYREERPHMRRKTAVCDRLIRSFATIDRIGRTPTDSTPLPEPLEARVQLIERIYASQLVAQPRPTFAETTDPATASRR